jgi:hypothetical protein
MTTKVVIECDALGCSNEIDNYGTSDDVQQLIEWHKWHEDPVTDEFHYCPRCWPVVKAEYEECE